MDRVLDETKPNDKEALRRLFRMKKTERMMMRANQYNTQQVYPVTIDRTAKAPVIFSITDTDWMDQNLPLSNLLAKRKQIYQIGNYKTQIMQSRHDFGTIYFRRDKNGKLLATFFMYLSSESSGKHVLSDTIKYSISIFINWKPNFQFEYERIIAVAEYGFHHQLRKFFTEEIPSFKTTLLLDKDIAFYRPHHSLQPISTKIIRKEELEEWEKEEGIRAGRLPMAIEDDLLCKWYGTKQGDVLMHTIMGTTTDTAGYYRITRKNPPKK